MNKPTFIFLLIVLIFVFPQVKAQQIKSFSEEPDQFIEGTVGLDLAKDSHQRIYVLDPKKQAIRIFERKTDMNIGE